MSPVVIRVRLVNNFDLPKEEGGLDAAELVRVPPCRASIPSHYRNISTSNRLCLRNSYDDLFTNTDLHTRPDNRPTLNTAPPRFHTPLSLLRHQTYTTRILNWT